MAGRYTDQHPQFSDSNGVPLADGEVEFFIVGTTGDGNRKDTYSDALLTTPNTNPVALDGSGRSVTPIFLSGTYNTILRNSSLVQEDEVDNVTGPSSSEGLGSQVVDLVADLKPIDTTAFKEVYVLGTTVVGDGGNGNFYFNSTSTESDNSKDIIEPDVGGGRWLLQNNAHNSFMYEIASGSTDAITINPTPIITTLDKTRVFFVQSLGDNTIAAPTFKAGTSAALTISRNASTALELGDTGPAGNIMILKLRDSEAAYRLVNPFKSSTANLVDDAVTTAKINDLAVTTAKINALAVTTAKINALAVTSSELGALAVTEAKINSLAVTEGKIGALAVTEAKIGGGAVTNAKLADMAQSTIKGRASGAGTGDPTDLTPAQVYSIISDEIVLGLRYRSGLTITNGTDSDHDIDIASGSIMNASNIEPIALSSAITKRIDAVWSAGTGNGGRASAVSLSNNTWYRVFLIKSSAGVVDAGFDTSSSAANLLSDSGYGFSRRIGWVLTDGSANIIDWVLGGENEYIWDVAASNLAAAPSAAGASLTVTAPPSQSANLHMSILNNGSAVQTYFLVTQNDQTNTAPTHNICDAVTAAAGSNTDSSTKIIKIDSSSQVRQRANDATGEARVTTKGWVDNQEIA